MTTYSYTNQVFAPVDEDLTLERFAGGNETEVYRTDNRRHVIKIKSDLGWDVAGAVAYARSLQATADLLADCLGPRYSIRSDYLLARDDQQHVQVLVVQPFLSHARPLFAVDFSALSDAERAQVADQLYDIVRRSRRLYRLHRCMPDLYGRSSSSSEHRRRMRRPFMIPKRVWSFLVQRNLLRSHNLLLTDGPDRRIVLVDYDPVRRSKLYRRIYYTLRQILFIRDHIVIAAMRHGLLLPRSGAAKAGAQASLSQR